jgi:hypothetical protein
MIKMALDDGEHKRSVQRCHISLRNTPIIVVFATNVPDVEFRHERLAPESPIISDAVIAVIVPLITVHIRSLCTWELQVPALPPFCTFAAINLSLKSKKLLEQLLNFTLIWI